MKVYAYKNKKVGFFMPPFFKNEEPNIIATDQYRAIATNLKKAKENHIEELQIFLLGQFDDNTGKFDLMDEPRLVMDCQEIMYNLLEAEQSKHEG